MKKRVTGLGGIFFKSKDNEKLKKWYAKHLGIPAGQYGHNFEWRDNDDPKKKGLTVWNPFEGETKYFQPSERDFMINYRVENLVELLDVLKEEGVKIAGEMQEFEYGKFAWIMDCDGNKIELWEPVDGYEF